MPKFPMELEHIWSAFWRLRRRATNIMGRQPIAWADFSHFKANSGVTLGSWDIGLIEMLDDLYLEARPEESDDEE